MQEDFLMFYKMISKARDRWFASTDCTVGFLINYMERKGELRGTQIEAVKTYLFLKIGCGNRPLSELFAKGAFNSLNLDELPLTSAVRRYMESVPAAAALYEYACQKNDGQEQVSPALERLLSETPEQVDCRQFFKDAFYGVTYTDYLFSLPMGAGKTWLMAAFIFLDLYFAHNEPDNPAFAHNFIIFAPSGLKSSVVPSLKTIQKFDPSWVLPEPAASDIKRRIIFEVLDQNKPGKKSNRTRNPNVQKIASHQPLSDLFGLVAVTNAEKVILECIQEKEGQIAFMEQSRDERDCQANDLRNLIGKLPLLSVFIDEVHHAVREEIKLRVVIKDWMEKHALNSVIGFSGTPYLEKAEHISVGKSGLITSFSEVSNVVYYYPLAGAVGSFLKKPVVKISDAPDSEIIIEEGVRAFFDTYRDTVYENGLTAKLGIYCGSIEKCEEIVYPLVLRILSEYDVPSTAVLRFHRGNRKYPKGVDSQMNFDTLDQPDSRIRVVLLVQIGKEGWDCKSLTGIILSQEGDCPRNMVLQTTCRCLRQVVKGRQETALIYLNEGNAKKLNDQLLKEQHISLDDFCACGTGRGERKPYKRTGIPGLPPLSYYEMRVRYKDYTVERAADTEQKIRDCAACEKAGNIVKTADNLTSMKTVETEVIYRERGGEPAGFLAWLYWLSKSSFGFVTMEQLRAQEAALKYVFECITYTDGSGVRRFSSLADRKKVEAGIRRAFYDKRDSAAEENFVLTDARLLKTENCTFHTRAEQSNRHYPAGETAQNIVKADEGKLELTYRFDSEPERKFFEDVLTLREMEELGLEIYYNGGRTLAGFQVRCFKKDDGSWRYVGRYTPNFLILKRKNDEIYKVLITETKGKDCGQSAGFREKRRFMETVFVGRNNEKYGYEKFAYFYLEDSLSESERLIFTQKKIREFFREEKDICR